MRALLKNEWTVFGIAFLASALTGVLTFIHANTALVFLISAIGLATLAMVVGQATEQLGNYLGPGATGILQASVASMPELFVSFFALKAGLVAVVQSAIVGSILANSLLVMVLAFSALVVPTLAQSIHTPASAHEEALSIASALVLLTVFFASIPFSLKGDRKSKRM